ncbi:hypothetical protein LA303_07950 [Candidatus Sulfidibacterium hydrothermale]|uniref:hypothetical protein n=1 Tax=Candidatus Sulfidibacterium hydrothermale TaxID=2875962 RepID=UPI001F0B3B09|nr:hypothetical protein [Candidatus Sulfidibacterium hydrothermale]UBM61356.1 hypothetical protein LA303_07950 [Candidatus Sulfidibacterium hydrothermale]
MESNTILSSILTASSILVAVGFPFIIFIVTDYKNKKEKLIEEIKTYYPNLNSFRKLIYHVYNTGVIKDFDRELLRAKTNVEKENVEKNDAFPFFRALKYISKKYEEDLANDNNINRYFGFKEVKKYQLYSNRIWHDIDCRTDIKKELNNNQFENLEPNEREKINEAIAEIDTKYLENKLTISVIASIAGDFEVNTANDLAKKTWIYEKPIPKTVKQLFIVLTVSVFFGVIFPLTLLIFPTLQHSFLLIGIVALTILCFISVVLITWKYIWTKFD